MQLQCPLVQFVFYVNDKTVKSHAKNHFTLKHVQKVFGGTEL